MQKSKRYISSLKRTLTYSNEVYQKALGEYRALSQKIAELSPVSIPFAAVYDELQGYNYEVYDDKHQFDCNFGQLNVTIYEYPSKRKVVGSTFTIFGNPDSHYGEAFSYEDLKKVIELIESEEL